MNKIIFKTLLIALIFASSPAIANEAKANKKVEVKKQKTEKKQPKKAEKKSEAKSAKKTNEQKNKKSSSDENSAFIKSYEGWDLFKSREDSRSTCFITAKPQKESGTFKKRTEPYLLVTYRGSGTPEVSISAGYNYKKESIVEVAVQNKAEAKAFEFFTSDKTPKVAWARDSKTDSEVINAMKKGASLTAKASSTADTTSTDVYSTKGFVAAVDGLLKACK